MPAVQDSLRGDNGPLGLPPTDNAQSVNLGLAPGKPSR